MILCLLRINMLLATSSHDRHGFTLKRKNLKEFSVIFYKKAKWGIKRSCVTPLVVYLLQKTELLSKNIGNIIVAWHVAWHVYQRIMQISRSFSLTRWLTLIRQSRCAKPRKTIPLKNRLFEYKTSKKFFGSWLIV